MTKKLEMYKCEICGNLVEVVIDGAGELVCCGRPMDLIVPKQIETAEMEEKHVPVFHKSNEGLEIRVGVIPHPMEKEHYIQFIEAISENEKYVKRKYLLPGEEPMLNLKCIDISSIKALGYCNIHGLWTSKYNL